MTAGAELVPRRAVTWFHTAVQRLRGYTTERPAQHLPGEVSEPIKYDNGRGGAICFHCWQLSTQRGSPAIDDLDIGMTIFESQSAVIALTPAQNTRHVSWRLCSTIRKLRPLGAPAFGFVIVRKPGLESQAN